MCLKLKLVFYRFPVEHYTIPGAGLGGVGATGLE